MGVTSDPNDPRLGRGVDQERQPQQNDVYLVLSEEERAQGFCRPVRQSYKHATALGGCGHITTMGLSIAETYARQPNFYGATWCATCSKHRPVGLDGEFIWIDPITGRDTEEKVGT